MGSVHDAIVIINPRSAQMTQSFSRHFVFPVSLTNKTGLDTQSLQTGCKWYRRLGLLQLMRGKTGPERGYINHQHRSSFCQSRDLFEKTDIHTVINADVFSIFPF